MRGRIPASRSTNLLEQTRLIQQFNNTQLELQKLQNSISTGRRIALPGEDPSAAQRGQAVEPCVTELRGSPQMHVRINNGQRSHRIKTVSR